MAWPMPAVEPVTSAVFPKIDFHPLISIVDEEISEAVAQTAIAAQLLPNKKAALEAPLLKT